MKLILISFIIIFLLIIVIKNNYVESFRNYYICYINNRNYRKCTWYNTKLNISSLKPWVPWSMFN